MAKRNTTKLKDSLSPVPHEQVMVELFREDPELAAEYLKQSIANGGQQEFLRAMRYITSAFGEIPGVAMRSTLTTLRW